MILRVSPSGHRASRGKNGHTATWSNCPGIRSMHEKYPEHEHEDTFPNQSKVVLVFLDCFLGRLVRSLPLTPNKTRQMCEHTNQSVQQTKIPRSLYFSLITLNLSIRVYQTKIPRLLYTSYLADRMVPIVGMNVSQGLLGLVPSRCTHCESYSAHSFRHSRALPPTPRFIFCARISHS